MREALWFHIEVFLQTIDSGDIYVSNYKDVPKDLSLENILKIFYGQYAKALVKSRIVKKLKLDGIRLPKKKLEEIVRKTFEAAQNNTDYIFNIDEKYLPKKLRKIDKTVALSIEEPDSPLEVEQFKSRFEIFFKENYPKFIDESSRIVYRHVNKKNHKFIKESGKSRTGFEKRLYRKWKQPLDLLEYFIGLSFEFGNSLSEVQGGDTKSAVLRRMGARAIQVSQEGLCLLKAGYANGADARWRTLHEIAVIACLISKNDEKIATRYTAHDVVEARQIMVQYKKFYDRLGYEPLNEQEEKFTEEAYQKVIELYGDDFKSDYGWASTVVRNVSGEEIKRPSFADLEKATGLDHYRPIYKFASMHVHANPRGMFVRYSHDDGSYIAAGASDMGLAEPGHGIAISLLQVMTAYSASVKTETNHLLAISMFTHFLEIIGHKFLKCDNALKSNRK